MSTEVIKAVLEADSTDFTAELQRAEATIMRFEKTARRAREVGLPSMPLGADFDSSMARAAATAGTLQQSMRGIGGGAGAGAQGLLLFSQAADDAQYGIRGVLNNIPGLVMAIGGTAGLAGAVSLGALAISRLIPLWEQMNGTAEDRAIADAAKVWEETYQKAMKAAEGIREAAAAEREAASASNAWQQALDARFQTGSQMDGFYDGALAAAREERDLTLEILKAREAALRATGGDTSGVSSKIAAVESAGTEADLENRRKALAQVEGELLDLTEKRKVLAAETAAGELASTDALVDAKQRLARYEADLAAAEKLRASIKPLSGLGAEAAEAAALLPDMSLIGALGKSAVAGKKSDQDQLANLAANAAIYREQIAKIQAEITALEQQAAAAGPASADKLRALDEAIQKRNGETRAILDQVKALETLKAQQTALNSIEAQRQAIAADQATLAALKKEAPKLEKAADLAGNQDAAADALLDEVALQREILAQGEDKAKQLREEADLRQRVADIVKQTALSVEDAQAVAEEQLRLQKALAQGPGPQGSIKERRQARSDERAAERERKRNERVAEAERKRKEKGPDGKPREQQDQLDIDAIRERSERRKQAAEEAARKNGEEQSKTLKAIEKRLVVLEKLATA